MKIHLVTPAFESNSVLADEISATAKALDAIGHTVDVFTRNSVGNMLPCYDYRDAAVLVSDDDLVIFYFHLPSIQDLDFIRTLPCRVVLRFRATPSRLAFVPSSVYEAQRLRTRELLIPEFLACRVVHCLTDSMVERAQLISLGENETDVSFFPPLHAIDVLKRTKANASSQAQILCASLNVLFVGQVSGGGPADHLGNIIATTLRAGVAPPRFHIVHQSKDGLPDYSDRLRAEIDAAGFGDWVTFYHNPAPSDLVALYGTCDLFFRPIEYDALDNGTLLALGFGLPIVSTDWPTVSALLPNAIALGTPPGGQADAILQLLVDSPRRQAMGKAAMDYYMSQFSARSVANTLEAFITWLQADMEAHPTTRTDVGWKFTELPGLSKVLDEMVSLYAETRRRRLRTRDEKLDLLTWALQIGRAKSPHLRDYFSSGFLRNHLQAILRDKFSGSGLTPGMVLLWECSAWAQATFHLDDEQEVEAFRTWYFRDGLHQYKMYEFLDSEERRFLLQPVRIGVGPDETLRRVELSLWQSNIALTGRFPIHNGSLGAYKVWLAGPLATDADGGLCDLLHVREHHEVWAAQ